MQPPGPGPLRFGVRTRGFLDVVGEAWRDHGDVFQVRLGPRRSVFAIHPDERSSTARCGSVDRPPD
jgi:hypothetical protein